MVTVLHPALVLGGPKMIWPLARSTTATPNRHGRSVGVDIATAQRGELAAARIEDEATAQVRKLITGSTH
jgi:hypothetical protein